MKGLSDVEKGNLLKAAKKICAHKLVQTKGYRTLFKRASDEGIKHLLIRIADEEAS